MKKAVVLLMVLALTLVNLAGCSNANAASSENRDDQKLRIGILQFAPHPSLDNCRIGFIDGLADLGYADDKVVFDYQNANADMNLGNTMTQKMAADGCDIIVGIATPAAQAAFNASVDKDIPVVFIAVSNPVAAGIVESMENPVNNVTGVSDVLQVEEQINLIKELLPEVKTLGVLYNIGEINSVYQVEALKTAAEASGYRLVSATVTNVSDVNLALESLLNRIDCLVNVLDNTVVSAMASIADRCAQRNIPIIGSEEEQVGEGALASNGFDYVGVGRQSAAMAAKILDGVKACDIPCELAKDTQIVINRQVVDALDIKVPSGIETTAKFVN